MNEGSAASHLPDIERRRLRALADGDVATATLLHADDYQLITPNGSAMTRDDYLGDVESGRLPYRVFEPVSDIAVLGDAPVAILRYQARISFDDGPGFACWHTDCYRLRDERWQVVWSQATRIITPEQPRLPPKRFGSARKRERQSLTMGFDRRPLAPGDAGDWGALLTAIANADGSDDHTSEQDVQETFGHPRHDFARGSVAIYDGRTMIGYGMLTLRGVADPEHTILHEGGVHPSYRGRGLGAELLDWAERAAVPLHNDLFPGRQLSLSSGCLSTNAGAVALHEQRGYRPVRWFHSMVRDLSAPIPAVEIPAGVAIVGYAPDLAEHARQIRNESFRDHWGSIETSAESWAYFLASSAFRPGLSFLAYQGSEPLGMLIGQEYEAYHERTGHRDLHIALVGTRAAGRKRGIATALLMTAMSGARANGYDRASLGVDADSLTGAVRLYERAGFTVAHTWTAYRKQLT